MKTLKDFRETKKAMTVAQYEEKWQAEAYPADSEAEVKQVLTYAGPYYILDLGDAYELVLGNMVYDSQDLAHLEALLWDGFVWVEEEVNPEDYVEDLHHRAREMAAALGYPGASLDEVPTDKMNEEEKMAWKYLVQAFHDEVIDSLRAGCHTPRETWNYLKQLNKATRQWGRPNFFKDSSYKNDLTDSLWNEENGIQVFLPNSENDNPDEEEFNTFSVVVNEGTEPVQFKTMEEVVEFVKPLLK